MSKQILTSGKLGRRCDELIFNFGQQLLQKKILIEELGDYIPGSVMVQDLSSMRNVYMNKTGCDILLHSSEELANLGSDYFRKFFPPDEINLHLKNLQNFVQLNDPDINTSFFQRVRPNIQTSYRWYLTTSRICISMTDPEKIGIMHVSIDVNSLTNAERKLSALIEENKFVSKHLSKYDRLTKREREILKLIGFGKTCQEISDLLFISRHTVHNHRKHINRKLELTSFSQLMRFAIEFFGEV